MKCMTYNSYAYSFLFFVFFYCYESSSQKKIFSFLFQIIILRKIYLFFYVYTPQKLIWKERIYLYCKPTFFYTKCLVLVQFSFKLLLCEICFNICRVHKNWYKSKDIYIYIVSPLFSTKILVSVSLPLNFSFCYISFW